MAYCHVEHEDEQSAWFEQFHYEYFTGEFLNLIGIHNARTTVSRDRDRQTEQHANLAEL